MTSFIVRLAVACGLVVVALLFASVMIVAGIVSILYRGAERAVALAVLAGGAVLYRRYNR